MKYVVGLDIGGNLGKGTPVDLYTGEFIGELNTINLEGISDNSEVSKRIINWVKSFSPVDKTIGIGICAAGDFEESELIIKKSPNSSIRGVITFPRDLKAAGYDVTLCNDMQGAVQDSARWGEGSDLDNVCTATYSEGHNAAVARNKRCVTKAELGHIVYKEHGDLYCGCESRGHLEPYVSARGAEGIARNFFHMTNKRDHPILEHVVKRLGLKPKEINNNFEGVVSKIKAKDVYNAWREFPEMDPQVYIRETQVNAIKFSLGYMASTWNPLDIIVCMGGQTLDKDILFYGKDGAITRFRQDSEKSGVKSCLKSLDKPRVVVTDRVEIGVRGSAADYVTKRPGKIKKIKRSKK